MFWKYNYQGISWAIFILILLGLPGDKFERSKLEYADLAIHAFLFGVLAFLLAVGFLKQSSYKKLRVMTLRKVLILCVVYGIIVEILQATIFIHRTIELSDMVLNAVGALIGLSVFGAIYGIKSYW